MSYFLNLFSPETYEAFRRSDCTVSGFRERQQATADQLEPGDTLVCYMTKLSRWFGLLKIIEGPFVDRTPLFYSVEDPFVVRFKVDPLVVLDVEKAIPIREDEMWDHLSFTRGHEKRSATWTGRIRGSLAKMKDADGARIEELLQRSAQGGRTYPFDEDKYRKLTLRVRRADKDVSVSVPEEESSGPAHAAVETSARESHQIQATLAAMGVRMGMRVWIPMGDRAAVMGQRDFDPGQVLNRLPLNYDETTLKTIENIDVLWLRGRSIIRAFEVEHTTAVYSGILRMADLLALQPNMQINLHIVAPPERRSKVFEELRRPVFALLDRGPLSETCTFLSYENVREIANTPNLEHMRDSVLDEYVEEPE